MATGIRKRRWTPLAVFAVVMGFVTWWPLGVLATGYILWGGSVDELVDDAVERLRGMLKSPGKSVSTGNASFDAYKAETLKRLEDEEAAFSQYVQKLRQAQDRTELDRFLAERTERT